MIFLLITRCWRLLDRLVHNAYHLDLSGDSVRKLKSLRAKATKPVGAAVLADQ